MRLTLHPTAFPAGATVGVYAAEANNAAAAAKAAPRSSAVTTAVVSSAGDVAFTGLDADTRYWAAAQVNGTWVWVAIRTEPSKAASFSIDDPSDTALIVDVPSDQTADVLSIRKGGTPIFHVDSTGQVEVTTPAGLDSSVKIATTAWGWANMRARGIFNVKDPLFGAVGDGIADDTAAKQAALTAADAANGKFLVPPGTYKVSDTLTWLGACEIEIQKGAEIDGSDLAVGDTVFSLSGSVTLTSVVASNVAAGASTITLDTGEGANYATDDWIKLRDESFFETFTTEGTPNGEIAQVLSVAGDVLTLRSPIRRGPYNTADTASVDLLDMVDSPTVTGKGTIRGGGAASQHRGLIAEKTVGLLVESGIKFRGCESVAYQLIDCIEFEVWSPNVEGSNYANTGYGINFVNSCQDGNVYGGFARNCRHACTTGSSTGEYGVPTNIRVWGMTAKDTLATGDCFDTHAMGDGIWYIGCTSIDSGNNGYNIECPRAGIINGDVRRCTNHAFGFHNEAEVEAEYFCSGRASDVGGVGLRWEQSGGSHECRSAEFDVRLFRCTGNSIHFVNATADRFKNATLRAIINEPLGTVQVVWLNVAQDMAIGPIVISEAPATAHCLRLTDIKDSSVVGSEGRYLSTSTGRFVQGETLDNVSFDGNHCPNGGRGIHLSDDSTDCKIGPTNDMRGCTLQYNLGAGTGHTWDPAIADVGGVQTVNSDAAFQLTPFSDPRVTLHTGTLTANRAVTLNTTNAVRGMCFRVVRTGGGAFTLDVGTGPLKSLATNTYGEFTYSGSAWKLTGYGAL